MISQMPPLQQSPPQGYYGQPQQQSLGQQFMGGFRPSPSFEWERGQSQRAMDAKGAAAGNLMSGAHLKRSTRLGQQMMATEWDRYMQRLGQLSQAGQTASTSVANAGAAAAGGMASAYGNMGDAQAQGAIGQGRAWNTALNGVGSALGGMKSGIMPGEWDWLGTGQSPTGGDIGYGTPF